MERADLQKRDCPFFFNDSISSSMSSMSFTVGQSHTKIPNQLIPGKLPRLCRFYDVERSSIWQYLFDHISKQIRYVRSLFYEPLKKPAYQPAKNLLFPTIFDGSKLRFCKAVVIYYRTLPYISVGSILLFVRL